MNRLMRALSLGCMVAALATGTSRAQSLKPWRHGIVQAKSDAGIVMMVTRHDFARDQGLDLQFVQFKGDAIALKALIAGELDSYEGSPGAPLIAASRGVDLKIVGCYWPGLTYGIFSKPGLQSPEDLRGKTMAISSPGALPDLLARAVLDKYQIAPGEVHYAALGSDSDRMGAITAGIVDAAAASTEYKRFAEAHGDKLLLHAHDAVPNFMRFCTYVGGDTQAKNGDQVARFLAAEMKATRYALDHREETIALTREITKVGADDVRPVDLFDEVQKYAAVDPAMPVLKDKLAWMQDLLVKTGNLKAPSDLGKTVDDTSRLKALKIVAPDAAAK